MNSLISLHEFLSARVNSSVVLDVRSPSEYAHAHVPGSVNVPLLKDDERAIIGTLYKNEGKNSAIEKGFELAGPRFAELVRFARDLQPMGNLLVYCWRGGLRSTIVQWLLNTGGLTTTRLEGGYKAYRQWVLNTLQTNRNIHIIGGKTGSGKSELLHHLKRNNHQVIDLEGIASHKGSAFGHLGMPPQPSNEHFENMLADEWNSFNNTDPLWLENESRSIGRCLIPDGIYKQMRSAPVFELNVVSEIRIKRILQDYGIFSKLELISCTRKLEERLGGLRTNNAIVALEGDDLIGWVSILLEYYDKAYDHSNTKRLNPTIIEIAYDGYSFLEAEHKILNSLNPVIT